MKTHHIQDTQVGKNDAAVIAPAVLKEQFGALLGRATQRQVWLFFYESNGDPIKVMMPLDGLPDTPDAPTVTEDLGAMTFARLLSDRIHGIMGMTGAASCALVWERMGRGGPTPNDLSWAQALALGLADLSVLLQAQFLLNELEIVELPGSDKRNSAKRCWAGVTWCVRARGNSS